MSAIKEQNQQESQLINNEPKHIYKQQSHIQQLHQYKIKINSICQQSLLNTNKQMTLQYEHKFEIILKQCIELFGDDHPYMANFYFQFASLLMNNLQNQIQYYYKNLLTNRVKRLSGIIQSYKEYDNENEESQDQKQEEKEDVENHVNNGGQVGAGEDNKNYEKSTQVQNCSEKQVVFSESGAKRPSSEPHQPQTNQIYQTDQHLLENSSSPQSNQQSPSRQQQSPHQQQQQYQQQQEQEQQEQLIETIFLYLQKSLQIYESQKSKLTPSETSQQSPTALLPKEQIQKNLIMIYSRLGDVFMMDECYDEAIIEYKVAIKLINECMCVKQQQSQINEYSRRLSQMHYMLGTCMMHSHKSHCQENALEEFIESLTILIKYLKQIEQYDGIDETQIPSLSSKMRVDRMKYLTHPTDSKTVKQIKQAIGEILDRIDDSYQSYLIRKTNPKQKSMKKRTHEELLLSSVKKKLLHQPRKFDFDFQKSEGQQQDYNKQEIDEGNDLFVEFTKQTEQSEIYEI